MFSFWKIFYPSREQIIANIDTSREQIIVADIDTSGPRKRIIADIDSLLDVILKLLKANLDTLSEEARLSFMDEYDSLADARTRMNKGTDTSTLTEALDECETLKMRIENYFSRRLQTACRKCLADEIRRGPVPVASIAAAGSTNTSIALVDTDSSNRITRSDSAMTIGTGYSLATTESFVSANNYAPRQTTSSSSAASMQESYVPPVNNKDCMIFGRGSFAAGSPTFNLDSDDATGATTFVTNKSSARLPRQRRPFAGAYQPQATHTTTRQNCMYFEPGTEVVGSPTLNIRSARATGTIEQVITRHS
ncbi:hypothetical protein DEU56DRAFT_806585 [Suillus clintonianus]|uniref:uncharacterized protein n=1 Tax=Suillus clintonianus TaxID=1904413 RepID=UPI001B873BD5|nr:uncharacterized protein DEU56DRAFT_806585 [Suillus clintonianus]KAG2135800.1 hypothetical protein DEU56DRAFT_806585 [Suillus clintonianus]